MNELLTGGSTLQVAFLCSAVGGTLFFILKALAMIIGGFDHGHDMSTEHIAHEGFDGSDVAFKLLSINSLTGFFMMFGWTGLACLTEFSLSEGMSFAAAFGVGLLSMYVTATVFRGAMLLVSPGSRFSVKNAVGLKGQVYQRIPADGKGQIQVSVAGMSRELDALSADGVEINSFEPIEVVQVVDDSTVLVRVTK